jgi:hypothetical protein
VEASERRHSNQSDELSLVGSHHLKAGRSCSALPGVRSIIRNRRIDRREHW